MGGKFRESKKKNIRDRTCPCLSFVLCLHSSPAEAMHTLTALSYHLQQKVYYFEV